MKSEIRAKNNCMKIGDIYEFPGDTTCEPYIVIVTECDEEFFDGVVIYDQDNTQNDIGRLLDGLNKADFKRFEKELVLYN